MKIGRMAWKFACWFEWERGFGGAMNHANKPNKQTESKPSAANPANKLIPASINAIKLNKIQI